jgi:glutamine phosphoribosylpyrophosphate amidotransferase
MCAVIGLQLQNVTEKDLDLVRKIFHESQIRGMHATGVSFIRKGKVVTIKEPIPAKEFIKKHDPSEWIEDGNILAIGHCRYSTSDLKYNQPIANDEKSIVHNGVITQESPDKWKDLYGIDCETKNDSELLFHTSPNEWQDASISTISLTKDGMEYYRNGKRPMWVAKNGNNIIVTSTQDISYRAGVGRIDRMEFDGIDTQP